MLTSPLLRTQPMGYVIYALSYVRREKEKRKKSDYENDDIFTDFIILLLLMISNRESQRDVFANI